MHVSSQIMSQIVTLHSQGLNYQTIATRFDLAPRTVQERLCAAGLLEKQHRLSQKEWETAVSLYQGGMEADTVGRHVGVSGTAIRNRLRSLGLMRDSSASHRDYILNEHAFDGDTPESRYWLGLILADGYISNEGRIAISLKMPDAVVLNKYASFLGMKKTISLAYKTKRRILVGSISVRSKKLAEKLASFGLTPNKSLIVSPDHRLENDPDFWRGVIDGDGRVASDGSLFISLTGTEKTCLSFMRFCNIISPNLSIHYAGYLNRSFSYRVSGAHAKDVARVLYERIGPSIERKREEALRIINNQKIFICPQDHGTLTKDSRLPVPIPNAKITSSAKTTLRQVTIDHISCIGDIDLRCFTSLPVSKQIKGITSTAAASAFYHNESRWQARHREWRGPCDVWNDEKDKLLEYGRFHVKSVRNLIKNKSYVASQMSPAIPKAIYDLFSPASILDPCSGWGDRLAGALYAVQKPSYLGFDPNARLCDGYAHQIADANGNAEVRCMAFEDWVPVKSLVDLSFTSPPYYDTEIYADDEAQSIKRYGSFSKWVDGFYKPLIEGMKIATKKHILLNVADVTTRDGIKYPLVGLAIDLMGRPPDDVWAMRLASRRLSKQKTPPAEPILIWHQ